MGAVKLQNRPHEYMAVIAFRCGAMHETENTAGISHLLEHLMFKSRSVKRSMEVIEAFDAIGAQWNANTAVDYTLFYVRCHVEDALVAVRTMLKVVDKLDICEAVFEKEKKTVLEELALDDGAETVFDLAHKGTPYGNSVIGSRKTIERLTLADVTAYHARMYADPVVVYAGAAAAANALLDRFAGGGGGKGGPRLDINQGRVLGTKEFFKFKKLDADDPASCKLAYLAYPAGDPRSGAVSFFAFVLQKMVFMDARERKNLIYNISIKNRTGAHAGCLVISFKTRGGNIADVLKILFKHARAIGLGQVDLKRLQDKWQKHLDLEASSTFDACMRAIKERLFDIDREVAGSVPLDLKSLMDPRRLAFIIRAPRREHRGILKALNLE